MSVYLVKRSMELAHHVFCLNLGWCSASEPPVLLEDEAAVVARRIGGIDPQIAFQGLARLLKTRLAQHLVAKLAT